MYNRLRRRKTSNNWTLDDCIQAGVDNPGKDGFLLNVGCIAGDQQTYEVQVNTDYL